MIFWCFRCGPQSMLPIFLAPARSRFVPALVGKPVSLQGSLNFAAKKVTLIE